MLHYYIYLALLISASSLLPAVDLIIFSYHRPMQLYAFLESMQEYAQGIAQATVIYRADTARFESGYRMVKRHFPQVTFVKQSEKQRADFKPLTIRVLTENSAPHIVFAVDDIIITRPIDFERCAYLLETSKAYGFYLRLGKNIIESYSEQSTSRQPQFIPHREAYLWHFKTGTDDWNYPNSLDLTLFRKKSCVSTLSALNFTSPNTLEAVWASQHHPGATAQGICYAQSCMVNIPLNRIQNDSCSSNNRAMHLYTVEELLTLFLQGKKIDRTPLKNFLPPSPHFPYAPTFCEFAV